MYIDASALNTRILIFLLSFFRFPGHGTATFPSTGTETRRSHWPWGRLRDWVTAALIAEPAPTPWELLWDNYPVWASESARHSVVFAHLVSDIFAVNPGMLIFTSHYPSSLAVAVRGRERETPPHIHLHRELLGLGELVMAASPHHLRNYGAVQAKMWWHPNPGLYGPTSQGASQQTIRPNWSRSGQH